MNVCIFEDFFIPSLAPLNYLRHTSEIICGASTIKEKIENSFKGKNEFYIHCRKELENYCKEKFAAGKVNHLDDSCYLFLNSRVIFNKSNLANFISKNVIKENNSAWVSGETVIAFIISGDKPQKLNKKINSDDNLISIADIKSLGLKILNVQADEFKIINYASDLILYNEQVLRADLKHLTKKGKKGIYTEPKCKISKHAVLDVSDGDIYIGKETVIEPFVYIKGPVYIGEHCTIRAGATLYGPLSIGNHCKLNGEMTCSIIHSYVNKQHHGFLGHSYLCEWVNLGAGTTTSNLKNNYSKIVINVKGEPVNTNSIFLGSIIGDHTKTGINTMLNTGTQIGISSNLFGSGYHNKFIRSFSWADAGEKAPLVYDIEKALSTARTSMKRRNTELSKAYEELLKDIFAEKDLKPI